MLLSVSVLRLRYVGRCSHADQAENDDVYTAVHHHSGSIEGRRDTLKFFDGVPHEARMVYYLSLTTLHRSLR